MVAVIAVRYRITVASRHPRTPTVVIPSEARDLLFRLAAFLNTPPLTLRTRTRRSPFMPHNNATDALCGAAAE